MYGKLEITGTIKVLTGMHIGASSAFAAIGAVDSPVTRDTISDLPLIPGSSLKGKIRTLLAKKYNDKPQNHDNDAREIRKLFGSAKKNEVYPSKLIFSDLIMSNMDEIKSYGLNSATEVKFENSINRLSAVANPRQIERTIRGAKFPLTIIYNMEEEAEAVSDITILAEGLKLLTYDYLGGHGSRGYGKISFENLEIKPVVGEINSKIINECQLVLKEV